MVRELAMVYFTALCGASRPHIEGSSMLQVSGGVKASDREEYLLSMKQKVLDFARDGVPEAAKSFLDEIRGLLATDILGELAEEKRIQKGQHDDVEFAAFDTAWQTYSGTTYDDAEVIRTKQDHKECRDSEHTKWNITQVCAGEQQADQTAYNTKQGNVHTASGRSGVCQPENYEWRTSESLATYKGHVGNYKTAIEELISARTTLVAKIADCQGKGQDLSSQKDTCDGKQTTYENAACSYAVVYHNAITTYDSAYGNAKSSFEAEVPLWEAASENRVHQCQTVNTVICYIDALKAHDSKDDLETATGECDGAANSYDCSAYAFEPSDTPAQGEKLSVPAVCGEAGFEYFAATPEGTAVVDPCAACPALQ